MKNIDLRSSAIGFLMAVVAVGGLYLFLQKPSNEDGIVDLTDSQESISEIEDSTVPGIETKYVCQGYKSTYLREDIDYLNNYEVKDVLVEAGTATDRATIIVNEQAGYISMLTAASVSIGTTEPYRYDNYFFSNETHALASEQDEAKTETLLFKKDPGIAVWTKVGNFGPVLGVSAQAIYFVCGEAP